MTTDQGRREAVERVRSGLAHPASPSDGFHLAAIHGATVGDIRTVLSEYDIAQAERDKLSADLEREKGISAERWGAKQELLVEVAGLRAKLTALVDWVRAIAEYADRPRLDSDDAEQRGETTALRNLGAQAALLLAHHSAPVEPKDGAIDYTAVSFADFRTVLGRIEDEFPNYGDYSLALPCGHWRAIRDALSAPPTTPTSAPVEDVGGLVEKIARALCDVNGQDADEYAPLAMICGGANEPCLWWTFYEEHALAILAALSPSLIQPQGEER